MIYSQLFIKKNLKIPTVLSVLILFAFIYFISKYFLTTTVSTKAVKKNIKRMEITNVYPNQIAIFWQTDQPETNWLVYGKAVDQLNQIVLDDRDTENTKLKFVNHYFVIKNLDENTRYFFKIALSNGLFGNKNGQSFTFKTVSKNTQVSNLKPAYGKIVNKNGLPLENALVLLAINGSYKLSTLSKNSGEWLIPLNYIKSLSGEEKIKLEFLSENGEASIVNTYISQLSPLSQLVTIGNNYDILKREDVLSVLTNKKEFPIEIIFPKEKAIIPGEKPLIKGRAIPQNEVVLTLNEGKSSTTTVSRADKEGSWNLNLTSTLKPAEYLLTLKTKDKNGSDVVIRRSFFIAKSGEKVLGEATASATPTVTIVPTTTPISATPTEILTPSPPVTGGGTFYIALFSLIFILAGLGLLIL